MKFWYSASIISYLLLPFSLLFRLIVHIRRCLFQHHIITAYHAPKPVIIVGNLSVGGNGKTPVVIWLVQQLRQRGMTVGIISRGYGSQSSVYPLLVSEKTDPIQGGDEPVLIAKRTGTPVCISPNRKQAIEYLLEHYPCDIIVSDDGLQHYRLQRDIEIVVIDAKRQFGNGFLLPAGPLREPINRLQNVDLIIANGEELPYANSEMHLRPHYAVNLLNGEKRLLNKFNQGIAIAGIGNPARFFSMLKNAAIDLLETQSFQDHQQFNIKLFEKLPKNQPLFMTEKDAVKCQTFARENWWYVPVEAQIQGRGLNEFWQKVDRLTAKK
ncbi:tetraacyldisaccharide 4'-kinase [Rodentibacter caecimuris]|uniref:Tetraacyldisaccharide 4'-kinase n=1 Tax=Rodentibacter caecimuris TaxID=1796644 RepID=A0ABX3KYJ5_9PAST|nr:tetraacyldisaccharide 4'-kinase [Rodentibacter heylii]